MDQEAPVKSESQQRGGRDRARRRRPRPRHEPRIFTKYAPHKAADDRPLSCTSDTTLKPDQLFELYRY
ncbi:MAG: hypothetical protein ACREBC_14390, partial [Pyrinomonadaceae bacterium]